MKTIIDSTVISYNNDVELSDKIKDLRESQRIKVDNIINDICSGEVAPKEDEINPITPEDPKEPEISTETTIPTEPETPVDPVTPEEPESPIDPEETKVELDELKEENTTLLDESLDESSEELDEEELED